MSKRIFSLQPVVIWAGTFAAIALLVGFQIGLSFQSHPNFQNVLNSGAVRRLRSKGHIASSSEEEGGLSNMDHIASSSEEDGEEGEWRSIEIFQGKKKDPVWTTNLKEVDADVPNAQRHYLPPTGYLGQAKQDGIVSKLFNFKTNGYFVDLAANLAVQSSNTYMLEAKLNWTGLCIEAHPMYWESLARMRKCKVVAAAVGQKRMDQIPFAMGNAGMGGFIGKTFDNKQGVQQMMMYTIPLHDVLKRFHAPKRIQYMSLDVEGAELFIMKGFDFSQYVFELISVERPPLELIQILYSNGYRFLQCMIFFGDVLFAHQSVLSQLNLTSVAITETVAQINERDHINFDSNWTRLAEQGICRQRPEVFR